MSPPNALDVPTPEEAEEMEAKRRAWEAMTPEEREATAKEIDRETEARNKQEDEERAKENAEFQKEWVGKNATAISDYRKWIYTENVLLVRAGETVRVIAAEVHRHISDHILISTKEHGDQWVDDMCFRVKE